MGNLESASWPKGSRPPFQGPHFLLQKPCRDCSPCPPLLRLGEEGSIVLIYRGQMSRPREVCGHRPARLVVARRQNKPENSPWSDSESSQMLEPIQLYPLTRKLTERDSRDCKTWVPCIVRLPWASAGFSILLVCLTKTELLQGQNLAALPPQG